MPVFKAPVDDTLFILNDVLGIERVIIGDDAGRGAAGDDGFGPGLLPAFQSRRAEEEVAFDPSRCLWVCGGCAGGRSRIVDCGG